MVKKKNRLRILRTMRQKCLEVPKMPRISQMFDMKKLEMTMVEKPNLDKAVKAKFSKLF
jgi:hypothetical protein